jgi:hypothetical protein
MKYYINPGTALLKRKYKHIQIVKIKFKEIGNWIQIIFHLLYAKLLFVLITIKILIF